MSETSVKLQDLDFNGDGETLFVDKPLDWSSFDVVRYLKKRYDIRKIGHAGTLDPNATGLLIICTGRKTKALQSYVGLEKEYTGVMELGVRTDTFDSEGVVVERKTLDDVTDQRIRDVQSLFIGRQLQVPPMFSAAKFKGKPLYKLARRGRTVEREAREIEIAEFEILDISLPMITFRVVCSKGTYIRALVEDFGITLGCGATLRELRRTRIGTYHVSKAVSIAGVRGDPEAMLEGIERQ
ncbi:MAG: tRNA pseudouridine(55) synthase TruB [Ignavibacteria bacterium]|nr:tRNA pseudouridine(55) synthase TruB [Ignavibacteria bacterium]